MAAATRDKKGRPDRRRYRHRRRHLARRRQVRQLGEAHRRRSGIRRISRFATEGLRTTIAGTVDEVYRDSMSPAELSERIALLAGEEAIAEAGIGANGHFPGPLFLAPPPLEVEWADRIRWRKWRRPTPIPPIPT